MHQGSDAKRWQDVEPEIRRDWETRHRHMAAWDGLVEPIRYARESVAATSRPQEPGRGSVGGMAAAAFSDGGS